MAALRIVIVLFITMSASLAQRRRLILSDFGPYKVELKKIENCEDAGTNVMQLPSSKFQTIGKNSYRYTTAMIFPYGLSDKIKVVIDYSEKTKGRYKSQGAIPEMGICSMMKHHIRKASQIIFKQMGQEDCPVSPGNYSLSVDIVHPTFPLFKEYFYRQMRLQLFFKTAGKIVGCKIVFLDSVPKN